MNTEEILYVLITIVSLTSCYGFFKVDARIDQLKREVNDLREHNTTSI